MKTILFLLFTTALFSQQQQPPRVVTGNLIYSGFNYQAGEQTILKFNNYSITENIDSISGKTVKALLNKAGIPDSVLLYVAGFGSSIVDRVEIFFAFEGVMGKEDLDLCVQNSHHLSCGYASQDGLIIPNYLNLNIEQLQAVAAYIAAKYPLRSFMIKPFRFDMLPHFVIIKQAGNGKLADMRNIPKSFNLIEYFISLNYGIIWYQDDRGRQRSIFRPKSGWPVKS